MLNLRTSVDYICPILHSYQPISRKDPFLNNLSLSGLGICSSFSSRKPYCIYLCNEFGAEFRAFAMRKSEKKVRNLGKTSKSRAKKQRNFPPKGFEVSEDNTRDGNEDSYNTFSEPVRDNLNSNSSPASPTRDAVLKACTITSGILVAMGLLIRQASHVASMEGWPVLDASAEVSSRSINNWDSSFNIFLRYILLKAWPEFSESSEAANQQVLSSLQDLDYLIVAFLPGISEELLFRGALLPLLGLNWKSAIVVGAIFGGLHIGGGRRYPFAIWASFVGFIYGMATIISSSVIVPMVSHSLSNLIAAILWRYKSGSEKMIE